MAENKDRLKEIIDSVSESAEPVFEKVSQKAKPILDSAMKKAAPAADAVRSRSKKAADDMRVMGNDLADKAARRAIKCESFIQYASYEMPIADIEEKVRKDYLASGHRATSIRNIRIYIKPEERAAYYVVNNDDLGKVFF